MPLLSYFFTLRYVFFIRELTKPFIKAIWPPILLWVLFAAATALFVVHNERPELKPHLLVSLQTETPSRSTLWLTNDSLAGTSVIKIVTNYPNGYFFFNRIPAAQLFIPVAPATSNVVFTFTVKNDSAVTVSDLDMLVAFPEDWELGFDSLKWHEGGAHIAIPGHEVRLTNYQCLIAESPYALRPTDSLTFPDITILSPRLYKVPSSRIENIRLMVRATGYQSLLTANVFFLNAQTDFLKPVIFQAKMGKDGHLHPSLSSNELNKLFEDSQK